jgi:IS5 family transposase
MRPDVLHGEECKVWGDGGCQGQGEAIREAAPQAQDMTCRRTRYKNRVDELERARNRSKSRIRARVEHPFRILKRIFGFDEVEIPRPVPRTPTGCAPASRSETSTCTVNVWPSSGRSVP